MDTIYRISENITARSSRPELIMAFDKVKGVMYELNDTASSVFSLIDGKRTTTEIVTALQEAYEGEFDVMRAEVEEILNRFVAASMIEPA